MTSKPVLVPPISQIPGLSALDEAPERVESNIRSTDSDYIILCKMGGRQNLLGQVGAATTSSEAVSYPRCEWFYLEDNAYNDRLQEEVTAKEEPYKPAMPEYMIHHTWKEEGARTKKKKREPYPYRTEADPAMTTRRRRPSPSRQRGLQRTTLPVKSQTPAKPVRCLDPSMSQLLSYSFGR